MAIAAGAAQTNCDQADYWNSEAGAKWVEHQAAMDAMMAPVLAEVLARAALCPGERVLDIGCGTGVSTLAAARAVGPGGLAEGCDISRPMLARGQDRAAAEGLAQTRFVLADAQTHGFAPGGHDVMISRFGVMFFDDPVAAFANIARAMRPGGRMVFAAWAGMPDNPFFSIGAMAAMARLGPVPPMEPGAPGPMAFADKARVAGIMTAAELTGLRADTVALHLTPPGTPAEVAALMVRMGPAARVIQEREGTAADTAAIAADIAGRLAAMDGPQGVRIPAAVNFYAAALPG